MGEPDDDNKDNMDNDDRLTLYVQRLHEFRGKNQGKSRDVDLSGVARELGFSDQEMKDFVKDLRKRRVLAQGFILHRLPQDALDILQELKTLNPADKTLDEMLAEAWFILAQQNRHSRIRQQALDMIRQCAESSPENYRIIQFLSELGPSKKTARSPGSPLVGHTDHLHCMYDLGSHLLPGGRAIRRPRASQWRTSFTGVRAKQDVPGQR